MIVMLFEQIAFFVSFDEFNMHQLCLHISIRMSKHMLSKSRRDVLKVAPIFATSVRKKRGRSITQTLIKVKNS